MKSRNIVLLALAIGCGLVAAFLTAKLGATNKTAEMIPVLVAAKNIDQGTKLDEPEKLFVRKPFPRESVPPEYIDDLTQLKGKVLQRTLRAGTHCTIADITAKTSIDLPVGQDGTMYKGMAIRVSQDTAVSGFIRPGDRVDVMVVEKQHNGKASSTLLLQHVLVVAINEIAVQNGENTAAVKNANTVTLAVTQKEALILSLAQARGQLTLMLRSKDDKTSTKNRGRVESYDLNEEAVKANDPPPVEMEKVLIAKKDVTPGTKINDPAEFFEEKEVAKDTVPESCLRSADDLKGKTATKFVYGGMPVPKVAFEGELPKPTVATGAQPAGTPPPAVAAATKTQTLVIQVGTQAPQYVKYDEKGRLLEGGQAVNNAPTTKTPTAALPPGSTEIKPDAADPKPIDKGTKDD